MLCYDVLVLLLEEIKKSKGKISEVTLISMNGIYTVLMAL